MKNTTLSLNKKAILFCLLAFSSTGFAQHFTVTLDNFTVPTTTTFEVDIILIVDAPSTGVRLSGFSTGINYNPAILNGGFPCTTANCGSWSLIPGTIAPELEANGGLLPMTLANRLAPVGHLRIVQPIKHPSLVDILPGAYRIGRFRFTNVVPWLITEDAELWLQPTNINPVGSTNTQVNFAPYGSSVGPVTYTTTNPTDGAGLTLEYTQATPFRRSMTLATVANEVVSEIVTAYPNPFQDVFKFNMNTVSSEVVQVKVYDMLGKLMEDLTVAANEMNELQIGQNYQSGFYHIKVSQGDKTQSIRMIKQ